MDFCSDEIVPTHKKPPSNRNGMKRYILILETEAMAISQM